MKIKQIDTSVVENVELLYQLQTECLPYDKKYNVSDGVWWIAYQESRPVAFAGVVPSSRWRDTGYLCRSGVIKNYRGRGVQKRLIRVRQAYARKMGWAWLITDTYHNPPSSNSLISCGFRLFDPTNPWGAKGTLYWRKKL
jgi:GNAT superfamily N-acetyltransferase